MVEIDVGGTYVQDFLAPSRVKTDGKRPEYIISDSCECKEKTRMKENPRKRKLAFRT